MHPAINDIDHTKTKAMSPQTNGIGERFQKTMLNDFYQVTFRKKLYADMAELQKDPDEWMDKQEPDMVLRQSRSVISPTVSLGNDTITSNKN